MTDKKKGQAMANVSVIGAGSWGTALALLLCKNGHDVTVWSYKEEEVRTLSEKREHVSKLPGVKIPNEIFFTADLKEAVEGKDVVVLAVPSIHVRNTAKKMNAYVKGGQILVDVAKGIEEGTNKTLVEVIEEEVDNPVVVLSGPSHAEEVAFDIPTTVLTSSKNMKVAEDVQDLFMTKTFRVYTNDDLVGVEIGGAVKNIIALAAGVCDGLGYGDNTKAALMTRGMAEIVRIGTKLGGKIETFLGLTGMGDLIVTCTSMHSRNRKAGYLIGTGKTREEAVEEVGMVVEGIKACHAFYNLKEKLGVEMPITDALYKVLFEGKDARNMVRELLERDKKAENY